MSTSPPGSFLVSWAPKKEPRPVGYVIAYPDAFHAQNHAQAVRASDRREGRRRSVRAHQRRVRVGGFAADLWFVVVMEKEAPRG